MNEHPELAVIGGSGLYEFPGLEDVQEKHVNTPFGDPSGPLIIGTLEGRRVVFFARHGRGHRLPPSEVNYRANIFALKSMGIRRIVSVSACGSLRDDYSPGDIVVPDQLVDFTKNRKRTFFEEGFVAHIGVPNPFCPEVADQIVVSAKSAGAVVHPSGTFITVEGPRFSTRAESHLFRSWGMSIIGMTASPEAFLAREAEICYAVFAHVTDYDVWHMSEQPVTAEMVFSTVKENQAMAYEAIQYLVKNYEGRKTCECHQALKYAITTHRSELSPDLIQKLNPIVAKYLD